MSESNPDVTTWVNPPVFKLLMKSRMTGEGCAFPAPAEEVRGN